MAYASDIFDGTMALMDELNAGGEARTADTTEYQNRTPSIIDIMLSEFNILTGNSKPWASVEKLDDYVDVDDNFARSVMKYGLAANLLVDENPTAAAFYQQRYEELRNLFISRKVSSWEQIENVYGGIEFTNGSRW